MSIGHNSAFTLRLPAPPSTNSLYANRVGGRRKSDRYLTWLQAARVALIGQQRFYVPGVVILDITVERRDGRSDISNRVKAVEDFLVAEEFMDDDRHVWEVRARWAAKGSIDGCQIHVIPFMDMDIRNNERPSQGAVP